LLKVPLMVIMGDREVESGKLSLRTREGRDLRGLEPGELLDRVEQMARERDNRPGW